MLKSRWRWTAVAATCAMAVSLLVVVPASPAAAAYFGETSWDALDSAGDSQPSSDQAPVQAYNSGNRHQIWVWRGETSNRLWMQGQYYGSPLGPIQQIPNAQTPSAPAAVGVQNGFVILHRGNDNRIYYATNVGYRGISADNFSQWLPITTNNGTHFITTSDTPAIVEIGGRVVVAYRGETSSRIYTVDGSFYFTGGEAGEPRISWSNNVATAAYSSVGPGLANYAGTLYLFWREFNAIQFMARFPGGGWPNGRNEIPGSAGRVGGSGRPSAAANGQYMMVGWLGYQSAANDNAHSIWRSRFIGGSGWEAPQEDANRWHTYRSVTVVAVSVYFAMLMIGARDRIIYDKVVFRT